MEFRLVRHDVVDSTSERAFEALADGSARHGDVHVARGQTAGRGRRGNRWESATDEGLYASVVLRPGPPPLSPTGLTMAAGLAVRDALVALGAPPVPEESWRPWPADALRLDWPNDVVAGEAKLAGVLVESRGLVPADPSYLVGVGVDVLQRDFPAGLEAERAVTSLARLGIETEPEAVLRAVLDALGPRLASIRADPERLAADYLAATGLRGRTVRARIGEREHQGVIEELSLRTGISLRMSGGEGRRLMLEHVSALDVLDRPGPPRPGAPRPDGR